MRYLDMSIPKAEMREVLSLVCWLLAKCSLTFAMCTQLSEFKDHVLCF